MQTNEISITDDVKVKGSMVIFISGKGGVGKTVLSVNVAVELAKMGFSTCIMDGNFQFGDVNLAMDIKPSFTISDLVLRDEILENAKISYYLDKHSSGVEVLPAPIKPEQADLIDFIHIKSICEKLLDEHDFLIVDLPAGLWESNLNFIEMADKIFVVTDMSLSSLKNTKIMLKAMNMIKMEEKTTIIINRCDSQGIIKTNNVLNMLEVKEAAFICEDSKLVSKSFEIGIPFVISKPKDKISKNIADLAGKLCGKAEYPGKIK